MVKQTRRVDLWKDNRYWGIFLFGTGILYFIPNVLPGFPGRALAAFCMVMVFPLFAHSMYKLTKRVIMAGLALVAFALLVWQLLVHVSLMIGIPTLNLYSAIAVTVGAALPLLAKRLKHKATKQDVVDHSSSKFTIRAIAPY